MADGGDWHAHVHAGDMRANHGMLDLQEQETSCAAWEMARMANSNHARMATMPVATLAEYYECYVCYSTCVCAPRKSVRCEGGDRTMLGGDRGTRGVP